jgi:hypothetical protein
LQFPLPLWANLSHSVGQIVGARRFVLPFRSQKIEQF